MKIKKILALIIAFAVVLTFAACKNKDDKGTDTDTTTKQNETVAADVNDVGAEDENQTTLPAEEETRADGEPVSEKETVASGDGVSVKPQNTQKGLNSTNSRDVLDFYKTAAKKTGTLDATQHMSIKSIDFTPRNDFEKGLLTLFRGIADVALKANSTPRTDVPGYYQNLETEDLNSANAVVSGNYTIVTLNVKSQEDNEDTKDWRQGPVGHAVGTIGDISQVFDALPAIHVDHSRGDITLRYDSCKVVVKINNKTGKIETGTWSYTVNVTLTDIYASFAGSDELRLNGIGGSVNFDVKTNDQK